MSLNGRPDLLPIGALARRSRLSLKALLLYAELGLLPPAQVDPETGYRYYQAERIERARLIGCCAGSRCHWPASAVCSGSKASPRPGRFAPSGTRRRHRP